MDLRAACARFRTPAFELAPCGSTGVVSAGQGGRKPARSCGSASIHLSRLSSGSKHAVDGVLGPDPETAKRGSHPI